MISFLSRFRRSAIAVSIALLIGAGAFLPSPAKALNTTPMWVAVGQGTPTTPAIAWSTDGLTWNNVPRDDNTFYLGWGVAWSGTRWVAAGQYSNSLAYSDDGMNWTGITGVNLFSVNAFGVAWNGTMWVAVGQGTNSIAYSYDGINWTGLGTSIFSSWGKAVAWNGTMWVAVGNGTNTIAYSYDGINWTGASVPGAIFPTLGNGIAWSGTRWVAGGGNGASSTIAYSDDGIHWTGLGNTVFSTAGNGIAWSGTKFLATGQGGATARYSSDGITWTGASGGLPTSSRFIACTTARCVMVGAGGATSLAYSDDGGLNWTNLGALFQNGYGVASAPAPYLYPSRALAHPVPTTTSLSTSTAIFADAGFTLTVTGTNFDASSTVQWNSTALATTYVTSTSLTAVVPGSLMFTPGPASVYVLAPPTGGGASNAQSFNVQVLGSVSVGGGGGVPAPLPASSGGGGGSSTGSVANSSSTVTSDPDAALRVQIAELTTTLLNLQAQVAANGSAKFNHDLKLGMTDPDVRELQNYLNTHGFMVASSGPGSAGNETETFGALTLAAVIQFQEAHASDILIPAGITNGKGTGFVGALTRGVLNR